MAGKLPALTNDVPRIGDWADHVTTAFPEVRLKTFLEMRGRRGPVAPALRVAGPVGWPFL